MQRLHWTQKFSGGNLWYLMKGEKVLALVNWDVIIQQYYAKQGLRGNPQYVFKTLKFDDIEKVKDIVFKSVSSRLKQMKEE